MHIVLLFRSQTTNYHFWPRVVSLFVCVFCDIIFIIQHLASSTLYRCFFLPPLRASTRPASPQIMFGHAVTVFFKDVFAKHAALFKQMNVNANNGFGDVVAKIKTLPEEQRKAVEADIEAAYKSRPALAMV